MAEHNHWWLVANDGGEVTLVYGGPTEEIARQRGLELLGGMNFDIRKLPTRNLARASSLLKGTRLEETRNLKQATRKLHHVVKNKKTVAVSKPHHHVRMKPMSKSKTILKSRSQFASQHDPW